eukprot:comp19674_c0_seq1/m.23327 comp19674_c0_seq1/g.23327  ORF comp19674_c0_seq1/g.23327 comp19674_c0_seq1/m.23327 type:complete len:656 (-) comp19674_c0_seq1:428-2395(-)
MATHTFLPLAFSLASLPFAAAQTAFTDPTTNITLPPTAPEVTQCREQIQVTARAYTAGDLEDNWEVLQYRTFSIDYRSTSQEKKDFYGDCQAFNQEQLQLNPAAQQINKATVSLAPMPSTGKSLPVDSNPVGFSVEYKWMKDLFRSSPDPSIVNLWANLNTKGQGPGLLIGGNTGMHVRINDTKLPLYAESNIVIQPEEFKAIELFANTTNARLVMGVPMIYRDPRYAEEFVKDGILRYIQPQHIDALELGNEPDHWQLDKKCYRAGVFGPEDYMKEYLTTEKALIPHINSTNVKLQAPAIAGCNTFPKGALPCWQMVLPAFANETSNYTHFIAWHRYGNSGCSLKNNLRTLLADPIPGDETKSYDWLESVENHITPLGKRHVFSEGGAFSCGGNPCMSKTFASALWAVDNMLEVMYRNGSRSNMHTVLGHSYSPFSIFNLTGVSNGTGGQAEDAAGGDDSESRRRRRGVRRLRLDYRRQAPAPAPAPTNTTVGSPANSTTPAANSTSAIGVSAAPLFFAMWQVIQLVDNIQDPYIYRPQISFGDGSVNTSLIKAWGVGSSANMTKIVIVHKDVDQAGPLTVSIGSNGAPSAQISRMWTDSDVMSADAVLAGQKIGPNGKPTGERKLETVQVTNGVFVVPVNRLSVVVVEIPVKA